MLVLQNYLALSQSSRYLSAILIAQPTQSVIRPKSERSDKLRPVHDWTPKYCRTHVLQQHPSNSPVYHSLDNEVCEMKPTRRFYPTLVFVITFAHDSVCLSQDDCKLLSIWLDKSGSSRFSHISDFIRDCLQRPHVPHRMHIQTLHARLLFRAWLLHRIYTESFITQLW